MVVVVLVKEKGYTRVSFDLDLCARFISPYTYGKGKGVTGAGGGGGSIRE